MVIQVGDVTSGYQVVWNTVWSWGGGELKGGPRKVAGAVVRAHSTEGGSACSVAVSVHDVRRTQDDGGWERRRGPGTWWEEGQRDGSGQGCVRVRLRLCPRLHNDAQHPLHGESLAGGMGGRCLAGRGRWIASITWKSKQSWKGVISGQNIFNTL